MQTAIEQTAHRVRPTPKQKGVAVVRSFSNLLLRPRNAPTFGWLESLSLLVFASTVLLTILRHESWFDEAQAWLLARDSTLRDLFLHRLHYEGAPGLWHLLLWCEVHVGLSFTAMRLVTGALAIAGAAVFLRFSPLPRLLTALMPLTYFFQYQYAVVARSYVLAPLLVFCLMSLYSNRKSRPILFCLVAGLLANCSLHMGAFAAGLAVLYLQDRLRPAFGPWRAQFRHLAGPATLLLLLFGAAAATAYPTPDGSSTTANPIVRGIRGASSPTPTTGDKSVSLTPVPLQPPHQSRLATAAWKLVAVDASASPERRVRAGMFKHGLVLLTALTVPISTSNVLSLVFLLLLTVCLARAHRWMALLPYALILLCCVLISGEAHHIGLLWVALVAALWILSLVPAASGTDQRLRSALYGLTLILVLCQVGWSVHAVWSDLRYPYSPGMATAKFLSQIPPGTAIVSFDDESVTANAYLPRSPYTNQRVHYWPFSRTTDPSLFFEQAMAQQPRIVILRYSAPTQPIMSQWVTLLEPGTGIMDQHQLASLYHAGYRETHRFCGERFFRDRSESIDCRVVFEPGPTS